MAIVTSDDTDGIVMTVGEPSLEIRPGATVGSHTLVIAIDAVSNADILNYGLVMAGGTGGIGINAFGAVGVQIHNAAGGQIFGLQRGINLGGNTLFNAGTITGNDIGVFTAASGSGTTNLGTISGRIGIQTAGVLTNLGVIHGVAGIGSTGVFLMGIDQILVNAGTIQGPGDAVVLGTSSTLRNTGSIQGKVKGRGEADTVLNSGTITGNIDLRNGNDLYDGRRGEVSGFVVLGEGDDTALGGAGDEKFDGDLGNDFLNGGEGSDTVIFSGGDTITVNLSLTGPQATGEDSDTLIAIENVTTGGGNDTLTGNAGANILDAGEGNDTLTGGLGDDVLIGGFGDDTAAFSGTTAATVDLSKTGPQNTGHGLDTLTGIERLTGGAGNDSFIGTGGDNVLNGLAGHDTLTGEAGDDLLVGRAGNDVLSGGADKDTLTGGAGQDILSGGAGQDFFLFDALPSTGIDRIGDFVAVDDTIRLKKSVFAALELEVLDPDAFRLGAAAGEADDRIIYNKTTGQLFYDADGSGAAAKIHFATLTSTVKPTLTFADFVVV